MAFAELIMEDKNNRVRKAPVGFSWTVLFFGPFVPLVRGNILYLLVYIFLMILMSIFSFFIIPNIDIYFYGNLDEILGIDYYNPPSVDTYDVNDAYGAAFSFICCSFLNLIFSFIYNRIYIQNLAGKGFKVKSYSPEVLLRSDILDELPDNRFPAKEIIEKKTGIKL